MDSQNNISLNVNDLRGLTLSLSAIKKYKMELIDKMFSNKLIKSVSF